MRKTAPPSAQASDIQRLRASDFERVARPQQVRQGVSMRCQALHAEWHRVLATALAQCRTLGLGEAQVTSARGHTGR